MFMPIPGAKTRNKGSKATIAPYKPSTTYKQIQNFISVGKEQFAMELVDLSLKANKIDTTNLDDAAKLKKFKKVAPK